MLDAFLGLPPWIQTAVLTGWGLNKLTGGALSGIVGSLASGLVKGVLGMNAGVVNINAGIVNGGGVPGVPGGKGVGLLGTLVKGALPVTIVALGAGVAIALTDVLDPTFGPRLESGDRPLANRDPRRFDSTRACDRGHWLGDIAGNTGDDCPEHARTWWRRRARIPPERTIAAGRRGSGCLPSARCLRPSNRPRSMP